MAASPIKKKTNFGFEIFKYCSILKQTIFLIKAFGKKIRIEK